MSGPWLQTAVLCERVAGDEDGRVAALDIVDGVEVEAGRPIALNLIIAVVRGGWEGTIRLRVVAFDPLGEPIASMEVDGDPPPIPYAQSRILTPIELVPGRPGVFWFDVQLGRATVTRVPLRIDWRPTPEHDHA
jgi:hypothetical protein